MGTLNPWFEPVLSVGDSLELDGASLNSAEVFGKLPSNYEDKIDTVISKEQDLADQLLGSHRVQVPNLLVGDYFVKKEAVFRTPLVKISLGKTNPYLWDIMGTPLMQSFLKGFDDAIRPHFGNLLNKVDLMGINFRTIYIDFGFTTAIQGATLVYKKGNKMEYKKTSPGLLNILISSLNEVLGSFNGRLTAIAKESIPEAPEEFALPTNNEHVDKYRGLREVINKIPSPLFPIKEGGVGGFHYDSYSPRI